MTDTGATKQAATRPVPDVLYHYTTPSGALGIIDSSEVRASMIHYMNDSLEFKYALGLVQKIIDATPDVSDHARRLIATEFVDVVREVAVFVFSLTAHRDQLSQWRAYSGGGGGYALGFSREVLAAIAEEEQARLVPCEYAQGVQLELLRPVILEMVKRADALPPDARGRELYDEFATRFTEVAASIKHDSFEEECEWRLVFGPGVDPGRTGARARGSLLVPFYRCSIRRDGMYPLAKVVVGPSANAALAGRSLRYITTSKFGWPVVVDYSKSSLRPLS